jgi:hypothetical protein
VCLYVLGSAVHGERALPHFWVRRDWHTYLVSIWRWQRDLHCVHKPFIHGLLSIRKLPVRKLRPGPSSKERPRLEQRGKTSCSSNSRIPGFLWAHVEFLKNQLKSVVPLRLPTPCAFSPVVHPRGPLGLCNTFDEHPHDWTVALPHLRNAYTSKPNSSLNGLTPYDMLNGFCPRHPISNMHSLLFSCSVTLSPEEHVQ